jgi:serine/threonine protein kinase
VVKVIPCKTRYAQNAALHEANACSNLRRPEFVAVSIHSILVDPGDSSNEQRQMIKDHAARKIEGGGGQSRVPEYLRHVDDWGQVWLVFEYCGGGDLMGFWKEKRTEALMKGGGKGLEGVLDEKELLDWFVRLAQALAAIHEAHLVHRDIKLANIFLVQDEEKSDRLMPKIGDFGIAMASGSENSMKAAFTPGYVAPEIVLQNASATAASDVFSLGVVFLEMMTLNRLGPEGNPAQLLAQIGHATPNLKWMKPILKRMVDADPDQRPTSANLAQILETRRHEEHGDADTMTATVIDWTLCD